MTGRRPHGQIGHVTGTQKWVKRDNGFVARINPCNNKPSGQVGAYTDQQHYRQGIGAGSGAVWSCSGSSITRIDPGG